MAVVIFIVVFAAVIMTPPLLLLGVVSRRLMRLRIENRPRRGMWLAAGGLVLVTSYQSALSMALLVEGLDGAVSLGLRHVIALLLAWLCLCLRVALRPWRRMRRLGT